MDHPSWPLHLFSMDWLSFAIVTSVFHGLVESAIEVGASPPVFQGQVELTAFEIFIEIFVISPLHLLSMDWLSNLYKIFVTSVLHGLVEQAAIEVVVTSPVFQGLVELTTFEIFTEFFVISPVFQGLVECLLKFSLKFSSSRLFSKDWLSCPSSNFLRPFVILLLFFLPTSFAF